MAFVSASLSPSVAFHPSSAAGFVYRIAVVLILPVFPTPKIYSPLVSASKVTPQFWRFTAFAPALAVNPMQISSPAATSTVFTKSDVLEPKFAEVFTTSKP
jgi:hypothetical protein